MRKIPKINLINENNEIVLDRPGPFYDFIYADCIYENDNMNWLIYALSHMKDNGILIVQTDYHTVADYRFLLDEYLTFVNWLIYMNNWGGVPKNRFAQKHDDILVYCNGDKWKWYPERIQIPKTTAGTNFDKKGTGTKTPPSVFYDHASFSTVSSERTKVDGKSFGMQKPEWLMERLLLPFTDEGDEVLDMFAGTGTLGVVCKRLNRNYTGIEQDEQIFRAAKERIDGFV